MQQQRVQQQGSDGHDKGQLTYRSIEDLQSLGINVSDIKKLQEYGLHTVGSVLQTCGRDLVSIKGLSEAKVEKIREAARKLDCRGNQFKSGLEVKEKRRSVIQVCKSRFLYSLKDSKL
jgi:meiotic recombination protein DMC1